MRSRARSLALPAMCGMTASSMKFVLQMYIPLTSQVVDSPTILGDPRVTMTFVVRAAGRPLRLAPRLRAAAEVDPTLPAFGFKALDEYVSEAMWLPRLNMTFVSILSGAAGVLAMIGVFGITADSIRRRTRESGIRMALGASAGKIGARNSWLTLSIPNPSGTRVSRTCLPQGCW